MKTVELSVRPIYHRDADRIRSHVFICMLAYYVEWHMREKLRSVLLAEDDHASAAAVRTSIVAAAERSKSAQHKDATRRTVDDYPVQSFRDVLSDLAHSAATEFASPSLIPGLTSRRLPTHINNTSSISWKSRLNASVPESTHFNSPLSRHLPL